MTYKTKTRSNKLENVPDTGADPTSHFALGSRRKARFIGIDQSLTCTGVVVVDGGFCVMDAYTIPTKPDVFNEGRLDFIGGEIDSLLRRRAMYCHFVALERPAYGGSGQRDILAGVFWEIKRRIWVYNADLDIKDVAISSWKKYITGNGRASKALIKRSIEHRYGVKFNNENIYDAYGLLRFQAVRWKLEK